MTRGKDLFGDPVESGNSKPTAPPPPAPVPAKQGTLFDAGHGDLPGQQYLFDEFEGEPDGTGKR